MGIGRLGKRREGLGGIDLWAVEREMGLVENSYERTYVKIWLVTERLSILLIALGCRDSGGAVPPAQKWFNLSVCWGLCIGITNWISSTGTNGQSAPGLSGANLRLTRSTEGSDSCDFKLAWQADGRQAGRADRSPWKPLLCCVFVCRRITDFTKSDIMSEPFVPEQ